MEGHSGNAKSTTFINNLKDLWKNPRGTVILIEILAGVAIMIAFLLAAVGSSRRWSNRWIVQKGFFAAHALSLSLGTYSIGLMQTSPVKSEMFPIWTVCLFTLFGCIDPVTSYNGLDYKGPLSKIVFGICLQFGYVLVMSNSIIFSDIGNISISLLAAITFIKSFHRSMALLQQSRMRNIVEYFDGRSSDGGSRGPSLFRSRVDIDLEMLFDFSCPFNDTEGGRLICLLEISNAFSSGKWLRYEQFCYDACIALCLSHRLQWYFLGLGYPTTYPQTLKDIDYKWAFKVIEIESAFLYDIFFTGNPFLHYYQARAASLWALASFIGICSVGVAAAIHGTITSSPGGSIKVLDTTTADLVITFVILVSLALLQLMQLIQGWTSNWARCAIAWWLVTKPYDEARLGLKVPRWWPSWMSLKLAVAGSTNWFDKYIWQDRIGQCSILPEGRATLLEHKEEEGSLSPKKEYKGIYYHLCQKFSFFFFLRTICQKFSVCVVNMFGLDYIWEVLWDLLGSDANNRGTVRLDNDVKGFIIDFLGQIETDKLDGNWLSFPGDHPIVRENLPYCIHEDLQQFKSGGQGYRYTATYFMRWHTVTWHCEQLELEREEQAALSKISTSGETATGERNQDMNRNRRLANVLSKYCIYLVVSAPELLPGLATETKHAKAYFVETTRGALQGGIKGRFKLTDYYKSGACTSFTKSMGFANEFIGIMGHSDELWETLAHAWVRMLVYAAPYDNVEAHMRHLAQGGELITHLWAVLFHLDVREWKLPEVKNLQNISTIEDAQMILNDDDHDLDAVVFFASPDTLQVYHGDIVRATRLIDGVKFYLTSSPDVAKFLKFPAASILEGIDILFLNSTDKKFTFYGSQGADVTYDFALFVYKNKLASAKARAQETAPSTSRTPILIEEQSSEDGQTVLEIEEDEIQWPPPPPPS